MDRTTADAALAGLQLVPAAEGSTQQAKELERELLAHDIPVQVARPPPKGCCGSGCGCGAKLQLLVREEDVPRVAQLMHSEWIEAVRREGTVNEGLVQLGVEAKEGEPPCPACGFVGALVEGACGDCGLQLE